jgi:thiosulfate/3-mercaptopyruvate sulfurtransferase
MAAMQNAHHSTEPGPPTGPLIGPDELADRLAGPDAPALLDIRWQLGGPPGADEYAAGHIPGAHFIDLERELAARPAGAAGGRHPLPAPEVLGAALRRAGLRADRDAVVYDAGPATSAARAWWLLRWAGHDRVRVLDGGLRAWTDSGRPTSTEIPAAEQGDFVPSPGALPTVDADGAAELAAGVGLLLDARAGERYRGETEPVDPRAGHVPGAVSAPTSENLGPDGRFLPAGELAARFRALGAGDAPAVGVYCGSGVTAAHEILALTLAGYDAALYPGSWSEWSSTDRPAAP